MAASYTYTIFIDSPLTVTVDVITVTPSLCGPMTYTLLTALNAAFTYSTNLVVSTTDMTVANVYSIQFTAVATTSGGS